MWQSCSELLILLTNITSLYDIEFIHEVVPDQAWKWQVNSTKCTFLINKMSRIVRKPDFCLGENKGADQLRGNREADQRLCFRYSDSTIPLLLKSEISSF